MLDIDAGRRIEAALTEAKDSLFERGDTDVTWPDALVEVAERSLDAVPSAARRDRHRTWLHLDVTSGAATTTDGWRIPLVVRDRLLCDGVVQPVWECDGVPFASGRTQRVVGDRLRRVVERRDRGCRVPGCTNERYVEVHHIIHWLQGGVTDSWNLISLCPYHHRAHHRGLLGIAGNADTAGGVVVTDAHGRPLPTTNQPRLPDRDPDPPSEPYVPPTGERLDHRWFGGWVHPDELAAADDATANAGGRPPTRRTHHPLDRSGRSRQPLERDSVPERDILAPVQHQWRGRAVEPMNRPPERTAELVASQRMSASERYLAALLDAGEVAHGGRPLGPGTTVVADPRRNGTGTATCYPTPRGSIVWCDPGVLERLASVESDTALSAARFVDAAHELGATPLGYGHVRVLDGDVRRPDADPGELTVRDFGTDDAPPISMLAGLVAACEDDEVEEADLDLDRLDPALTLLVAPVGTIASYASARPHEVVHFCDDTAVLTHPACRGSTRPIASATP